MKEKKFITLGESTNVLKLWIRTKDGKETGEYLEFNLKDIEVLDRYQKMITENNKNKQWIENQFVIINKKQDFKKKDKLMSNNEEAKYNALLQFYKRQKEVFDMFLGEGGVDKLLYGRKLEWGTLNEIGTIIKEQIAPYLKTNMDNIAKEIKEKYNFTNKGDVLE
jgi:hypothetical protein